MTIFDQNPVLIALIWMLLANLFAIGPDRLKIAALVAMLLTAGPIIAAIIAQSGWLVGFPLLVLMLIQMRWAGFMIWRLAKSFGMAKSKED